MNKFLGFIPRSAASVVQIVFRARLCALLRLSEFITGPREGSLAMTPRAADVASVGPRTEGTAEALENVIMSVSVLREDGTALDSW